MKFKLTSFELEGVPSNYIVLHPSTAEENDIDPGSLLVTEDNSVGFRVLTSANVEQGFAGISAERFDNGNLVDGKEIDLISSGLESITRIIRRKMDKKTLSPLELDDFMGAIAHGLVTKSHMAAFGTAVQINGMHGDEITSAANAILKNSRRFSPGGKNVVDKHSIGGIAGNRITPLMIPIIAACGLTIPKISTRAITSPAGTVDALETIMPVDLTFEEASEVLDLTNACMVNGATVELGSVADKFLEAVGPLKIDPKEMMIASILAKKKAAGSDFVLIDLPTGKGSKLASREEARSLAYDFSRIGNSLGQHIEAVISPGDKPVGSMIGPSLEMIEVLKILENKGGALSLKRKATSLAGLILEGVKHANRGEGMQMATEYIDSGKAMMKLREIIEAQGGDPAVASDKIEAAPYTHTITAEKPDIVYALDSFSIGLMARAAGAPKDSNAGIIIHVDRGDIIKIGDPIVEIRSHSEGKLTEAINMMRTAPPIILEQSVLEHITGIQ
ncbi:MAG: thymidine phosphorylase [Candidatus Heimdallarchaeota archaeon]|nr:thymidine phosphorylase [Candidatus Heimdallarchaeota archaeon]